MGSDSAATCQQVLSHEVFSTLTDGTLAGGIQTWTQGQAMTSPGYKYNGPNRQWKKWISCKALAKQEHVDWYKVKDYVPSTVPPNIPLAATCCRLQSVNIDQDMVLGHYKFSYYVTFRG